jgi:hypothetical protein
MSSLSFQVVASPEKQRRPACRASMLASAPDLSLIMVEQEHPRFWRIKSPGSNKITESYCLGCSAFVGASESVVNLRLVELLHRARCKQKPNAGSPETRIS